ncbi:hypothetical protein J6590_046820 [Homalodisca vitripennis]|nr:hypothetical protein J6590_046820 [Homalodisca vitripennis]
MSLGYHLNCIRRITNSDLRNNHTSFSSRYKVAVGAAAIAVRNRPWTRKGTILPCSASAWPYRFSRKDEAHLRPDDTRGCLRVCAPSTPDVYPAVPPALCPPHLVPLPCLVYYWPLCTVVFVKPASANTTHYTTAATADAVLAVATELLVSHCQSLPQAPRKPYVTGEGETCI